MKRTLHFFVAVIILVSVTARAREVKIPAGAEGAAAAIKDSPRHGEYVDVALPGATDKVKTWVVYPEVKDQAPVVIVIHEIFGLTDWVRAVADQLAAEGFIAVAPDLLSGKGPNGGGTESFTGDAVRGAIQKLTPEEIEQRLNAVREYAIALPSANGKSATIGFCWGGSTSFAYATRQPKLNAAVVYYGTGPKQEISFQHVNCPVLGLYGGDDARVNQTIEPTAKGMKDAGKSYTQHIYDGAGHGFLRQQTGKDGANLKASNAAWAETIEFLNKNLK